MNTRMIAREAAALLALAVLALLALALYSYAPEDPSFNHAGGDMDAVRNQAGLVGAWAADALYQFFGLGAWPWLALGAWAAARLALGRKPALGGWASVFWLPWALAVCGLLAGHEAWARSWSAHLPAGAGGALGRLIANGLTGPLHAVGRDLLLGALAVSSFVAASRVSVLQLAARAMQGLAAAGRWLWDRAVVPVLGRLGGARQAIEERRERMTAMEERRETRKRKAPRLPKEEPEVAKPAKIEVSRRAREEAQPELALAEPAGKGFRLPSLNLFSKPKKAGREHGEESLQAMARMLEMKLLDYRVEGRVVAVQPGPVVTQFEFEPAPGTKVSRIVALQDDLARAMSAVSVRVAGNIPGKSVIGIEIPNEQRQTVYMHEVLASSEFADKRKRLPLALGVDIAGAPVVADLTRMPHLLIAGTTGSGKSVAVNGMICSMLMTHAPSDLRLILVDPKMLELSMYDDIPHLLAPVVTDPHKAARALAWAVFEMERRYRLMSEARVRNIDGYNKAVGKQTGDGAAERLPYVVIVIDELADLMMVAGKEVEQSICRLAQKARAAGIHLILATQRPSVDVITGLIKANLPSRMAFQVSSRVDSRTILDQMGAEQLLGQGDALFLAGGRDLRRVHGAFVSDAEVMGLVEHLRAQGEPDYREEVFELPEADGGGGEAEGDADPKYDEAVELVIEKGKCSVSMVQRFLRVGYNRASRIVERMEREGLVTPPGAGGMRKVLARSLEDGGGVME